MATEIQTADAVKTLTPVQVCRRLQISRATLNKLRTGGTFPRPVIEMHSCVRFSAAEVDAWLAAVSSQR
jgi:predicted DNA-binding transcriptional regulator AlpA